MPSEKMWAVVNAMPTRTRLVNVLFQRRSAVTEKNYYNKAYGVTTFRAIRVIVSWFDRDCITPGKARPK